MNTIDHLVRLRLAPDEACSITRDYRHSIKSTSWDYLYAAYQYGSLLSPWLCIGTHPVCHAMQPAVKSRVGNSYWLACPCHALHQSPHNAHQLLACITGSQPRVDPSRALSVVHDEVGLGRPVKVRPVGYICFYQVSDCLAIFEAVASKCVRFGVRHSIRVSALVTCGLHIRRGS